MFRKFSTTATNIAMAAVNPRKLSQQNSLLGSPNSPDATRPDTIMWNPNSQLLYGPGPVTQYRSRKTQNFIITEVPAVGFFYGQSDDESVLECVEGVFKESNDYAESSRAKNSHPLTLDDLKINGHYLFKIEEENFWYRVEVMEKCPSGQVKIFFLDCGNYELVSPSLLITMPVELENRRIHLKAIVMRDVDIIFEEECVDDYSRELLEWFRTRLVDQGVSVANVGDDTRSLVFLDQININEELKQKQFELGLKYQGLLSSNRSSATPPPHPSSNGPLSIVEAVDTKQVPVKMAVMTMAPATVSTTDNSPALPVKVTKPPTPSTTQSSPGTKRVMIISPNDEEACKDQNAKNPNKDSSGSPLTRDMVTIDEDNEDSSSCGSITEDSLLGEVIDMILKAKLSLREEREKDKKRKDIDALISRIERFFAEVQLDQVFKDVSALNDLVKEEELMNENQLLHESSIDRLEAGNDFAGILKNHREAVRRMAAKIQTQKTDLAEARKELDELSRLWNSEYGLTMMSTTAENFDAVMAKYKRWSEDHVLDLMDAEVNTQRSLADLSTTVCSVFERLVDDFRDENSTSTANIRIQDIDDAYAKFGNAAMHEKKLLKAKDSADLKDVLGVISFKLKATESEWSNLEEMTKKIEGKF